MSQTINSLSGCVRALRAASMAPGQTVVNSDDLAALLRDYDLLRSIGAANERYAADQAKRHAGMQRALLL